MLRSITINRDELTVRRDGVVYAGVISHHYLYPNRYEWNDPPGTGSAFHVVTTTLDEMAQAMRDAYHVPVTIE